MRVKRTVELAKLLRVDNTLCIVCYLFYRMKRKKESVGKVVRAGTYTRERCLPKHMKDIKYDSYRVSHRDVTHVE